MPYLADCLLIACACSTNTIFIYFIHINTYIILAVKLGIIGEEGVWINKQWRMCRHVKHNIQATSWFKLHIFRWRQGVESGKYAALYLTTNCQTDKYFTPVIIIFTISQFPINRAPGSYTAIYCTMYYIMICESHSTTGQCLYL
jgi:hypothetical protein